MHISQQQIAQLLGKLKTRRDWSRLAIFRYIYNVTFYFCTPGPEGYPMRNSGLNSYNIHVKEVDV